jgi:DNA-binding response OmpR family regulator
MDTQSQRPRILLIEDDPFLLDLFVNELRQWEFEVTIARTGEEGIEQFDAVNPDLIVADIILPDINGLEALRRIRRKPGGYETKAIILSNIADLTSQDEAKRLGVLDYIVKTNFSLPEVAEKIRSLLEKKEA